LQNIINKVPKHLNKAHLGLGGQNKKQNLQQNFTLYIPQEYDHTNLGMTKKEFLEQKERERRVAER